MDLLVSEYDKVIFTEVIIVKFSKYHTIFTGVKAITALLYRERKKSTLYYTTGLSYSSVVEKLPRLRALYFSASRIHHNVNV